ncbi:MAG: hemerythrin domain-containing protein [Ignavibacteriae bacterium]|nr:hemerythrin domain-containing protein [Ignavibacteriota bacterium]
MHQIQRPDLFTHIHKGLRLMLYELAADMQRTDFSRSDEETAIIARVLLCLDLLDEHGVHEDTSIFPAVQVMEPGTLRMLSIDHEQLASVSYSVKDAIETLRNAGAADKHIAGAELLRSFNTLVASQLHHMNREEDTALPATWKYLSDEQILAIRSGIQAKQTPERYKIWLRLMLRAMNSKEIELLHRSVQKAAPPAVVALIDAEIAELGARR